MDVPQVVISYPGGLPPVDPAGSASGNMAGFPLLSLTAGYRMDIQAGPHQTGSITINLHNRFGPSGTQSLVLFAGDIIMVDGRVYDWVQASGSTQSVQWVYVPLDAPPTFLGNWPLATYSIAELQLPPTSVAAVTGSTITDGSTAIPIGSRVDYCLAVQGALVTAGTQCDITLQGDSTGNIYASAGAGTAVASNFKMPVNEILDLTGGNGDSVAHFMSGSYNAAAAI